MSYNKNSQLKTVSYEKSITPVISEVQDLKQENDDLKDRIKVLEDRLNALEKKTLYFKK